MSHAGRPDDPSCERTTTFSRSFDRDEPPSEAVVTAVAAITGERAVDLPPLYDAVDPDALDAVFDGRGRTDDSPRRRVIFDYAGHEVRVRGEGQVRIVAPETPARS